MRRVEKLGIDMAYAMRELRSRRELYELASEEVKRIEQAILAADASEETGSQPAVPVEQPVAPTERFNAPVFEECPGSECWAYRQGKGHSHLAGRIWHN